ncbi:FAS1-like dehydratase domain-containing protein [Erythrobacter sp. WG]|uniref:FAS1-like dehydratase domain-containing protein n=1 Tax=Erythrobacter sp. WG TaxID=2985510 RepID=UPI00226EB896|nr:MaoC family dehydratase N-terminal domain-containing protein [Erythrobacter sp. WG]MCX9147536.1 MaoC family dehydratase N-terminal domain-containing protein [Erythrobacter sp. WG]
MSYDAWIGREIRAKDRLDEGLAARWLATFDLATPHPPIMPQGIHFALCTPQAPTAKLGEDGHPAREDGADSFLPSFQMPRRMWASSTIHFHAPIAIGAVIAQTSRIAAISEKQGSTGPLAFVDVSRETRANGTLAVVETQSIVYREAANPGQALAPPPLGEASFSPEGWDAHRVLTPDPRLLFRYSALTFNTHRIHYDAPYASEVERYRGLVVHGPLIASLLLQLAARELGENRLRAFRFRGLSPAIAGEPLHLVMRASAEGYELAAFAGDGRQVTAASAAL